MSPFPPRFVLLAVLGVFLCGFTALAQVDLPRVGTEIDSVERAYFHLFPSNLSFQSATLLSIDRERYTFVLRNRAGAEERLPLDAGLLDEFRAYLTNYERIVSTTADTSWAKRRYRWDALAAFVDPEPWLQRGPTIIVTMRDGRWISGHLLAVTESGLLIGDRPEPFDPADRIGVVRSVDSSQIAYVEEFSRSPLLWGYIGLVGGVAGGAVLNQDRTTTEVLSSGLAVGAFAGTLAESIADRVGVARVKPDPNGQAPFAEVRRCFQPLAPLPARYPANLISAERVVPVYINTTPLTADALYPRRRMTIGGSYMVQSLASPEDYQFSNTPTDVRRGEVVLPFSYSLFAEYAAFKRFGFGVEWVIPPPFSHAYHGHGEFAFAGSIGGYATFTPLTINDWTLPIEVEGVMGLGYNSVEVVGLIEEGSGVLDGYETIGKASGVGVIAGARLRVRPSYERLLPFGLTCALQAIYRSYPTVSTREMENFTGEYRLLPHSVDASGLGISVAIGVHF